MRSNRWIWVLSMIAVVCLVLGGIFYAAGKVMGGNIGWVQVFGHNIRNTSYYNGEFEDGSKSFEGVESMEIDLSMVELTIREGDTWNVAYYNFPKDRFKATQSGTHLQIRSDFRESFTGNTNFRVELTIPKEVRLSKADLSLAMGTLHVDRLQADTMEMEFSMTKVTLNNILAQTVAINSSMGDLDLDGIIEKQCTIDQSMGKVTVSLVGNEEEYYTKIDNSMGSVRVGGKKVDGLGGELSFYETASKSITISNSMGDVELRYR